jgi:hypothetical protein
MLWGWTQRFGSHWYRVVLLSIPDALAECAARLEVPDGGVASTLPCEGDTPGRRGRGGPPGGERALALHGPPDGEDRVVTAVLAGLRPGDYEVQAVPHTPPPGGGNPSKNRGKRRKRRMAAAADMPSVRALVKGHRGHRGHPNQCRQKTSTSDAADIEGGGLSRLGEGALAGQTPRQDGLRRRSKLRDRFGPRCRPRLQRRVGERFRPKFSLRFRRRLRFRL